MQKQILIFSIFVSIGLGFFAGWIVKGELNNNEFDEPNINLYNKKYDSRCELMISLKPLVVEYAENSFVNCDTASGVLESNICSGVEACLEREKFDSLYNEIIKIYNSLIIKNDKYEYPELDYRKIKELFKKSIFNYLEHVKLEIEIKGIEHEPGKSRSAYENCREIDLLKLKNKDLEKQINNE